MFSTVLPNGQMVHSNVRPPVIRESFGSRENTGGYHDAICGVRFSQYVQRTRKVDYPHCPRNGGRLVHKDLWHGRPLKVLLHRDATRWRMAKVESFLEWMPGPDPDPSRPVALWEMTIRFTDAEDNSCFSTGDMVEIHGLQNAKQHNGREGCVSSFVEKTGRFAVKYKTKSGNEQGVCVKPTNIRHVTKSMTYSLKRCNINGGGTMRKIWNGHMSDPADELRSFEWLEDATPKVNLFEDGWCVKCPTCRRPTRDHEMPNNDSVVVQHEAECPVCLDTTQCLPLANCSHSLCLACFKDCQTKPDGSSIVRMEDIQVNDSLEELARQREELEEMTQLSRTTEEGCVRIQEYLEDIADATNDNDQESLIAFKRWLLVHPIHIWLANDFLKDLVTMLGPHAAAIVLDRVENLKGTDEFQKFVIGIKEETRRSGGIRLCGISGPDADLLHDDLDVYHSYIMMHLTEWVGFKYEEIEDYRTAISLYEKTLLYTPLVPTVLEPRALSSGLGNLGLAQKHFGLYTSAETNYRKAIETAPFNPFYESPPHTNMNALQEELENWRGTSGTVTPRMEEETITDTHEGVE